MESHKEQSGNQIATRSQRLTIIFAKRARYPKSRIDSQHPENHHQAHEYRAYNDSQPSTRVSVNEIRCLSRRRRYSRNILWRNRRIHGSISLIRGVFLHFVVKRLMFGKICKEGFIDRRRSLCTGYTDGTCSIRFGHLIMPRSSFLPSSGPTIPQE